LLEFAFFSFQELQLEDETELEETLLEELLDGLEDETLDELDDAD